MFHILLPRPMNLDMAAAAAAAGQCPRQSMWLLARELDAQIHEPMAEHTSARDVFRAKLAGPRSLWAAARALAREIRVDDCIFCPSEAGGLQVAAVCGALRARPRICMYVHNLDRPRGRLALRLWNAPDRVDLFLACAQWQVDFLRRHLGLSASRAQFIWDHTDTRFFSPGPATALRRPSIVSVGLEQRD